MTEIGKHIDVRVARSRTHARIADALRDAQRRDKSGQINSADSIIDEESNTEIRATATIHITPTAAGLRLAGKLDDETGWEIEQVGSTYVELGYEIEVEK